MEKKIWEQRAAIFEDLHIFFEGKENFSTLSATLEISSVAFPCSYVQSYFPNASGSEW